MAKKWIKGAIGKEGKGKLHDHLGIAQGQKIPEDKLRAAAHSKNPTIRKEAQLAITLSGMHHDKPKRKAPSARGMRSKMYGSKE